jgi:hypothetical protein
MTSRLIAVLLVLLLAGCGFVSYEDVSSDARYSKYVGKTYQTVTSMQIYRISMDPDYGPSPSEYTIAPPPGFTGPEVLSSANLRVGSTFDVLAVKRCTNCYLEAHERAKLLVRLNSDKRFNSLEVYLPMEFLTTGMKEIQRVDPRS